uniref:palmitoyl-protein thioesterase 1-like n=1 Tax=Styela clava TaxID=7725 RepID=UPI0019397327|nr:palmitoyl-protein thioesterase 1-like [Styela clava]
MRSVIASIAFFFLLECSYITALRVPTPLVIWHGMGDTCCNPLSMGRIIKMVENQISGIYVHSLQIGSTFSEDTLNGFLMPVPEQIELACSKVQNDPHLQNGFNVMGFSQGAQFLRALIQQCDGITVHNLISIGGQHQGVYGFPNCMGDDIEMCDYVRRLLNMGAYFPPIQNRLVQAQYWHDPIHEDKYFSDCIFLPVINNDNVRNSTYVRRLRSLSKFVMVKFNNDTMVQPIESEWFGFYAPGKDNNILTLQETELYKNDQLGLKKMDEAGKLVFLATNGEHLQFSDDWFIENIVPYLQ